jgi:membrane-associated phospholipid phosphatase
MRIVLAVLLSLTATAWPSHLKAQEVPALTQQPPRVEQPDLGGQPNFVKGFLETHKDLWLSPFKAKRGDVKWLIPLGAGAAAFLATDGALSDSISGIDGADGASNVLSKMGGGAPLGLASGAMWGVGRLTNNDKAARTGKLALEAVLHTEIAVRGLKAIFSRERPNKVDGDGKFWGGGESFPSGHAATSFAFATVVAHEYKNKPLVAIGAYGLATAVTLSRVGGRHHFPSDVLIGAAVGHLIGRFILNRNDDDDYALRQIGTIREK